MLDPEIYHAVGMLIESWKTAEIFSWLGIAYLLKADVDRTQIAMSGMQARTMLTVLRTLVHHTDPDSRVEFDRLYARLEKALVYRNEVAHSPIQGLLTLTPSHVVNRKVRIQKRGVVLETKSPINAHKIFRRALYVKMATGFLMDFIERYRPPMTLPLEPVPPQTLQSRSQGSPRAGQGAQPPKS